MIKMLISNASKDGQWAGVPSTMCGVWGAQKCGFTLIGLQPSSLSTLLVRLLLFASETRWRAVGWCRR